MKQAFLEITDRINRACEDAGRDPSGVTFIAVSKNRDPDLIKQAIDLGLTHFGENRVQESADKWPELKTPDITLHLIGPLQSNKVKQASVLFDVLHTLDRENLWHEMQANNWSPPCFVQVNTGEEEQKSGILSAQLATTLPYFNGANIKGFMCIPPNDDSAALHFAYLNKMARQYQFSHLSMGMSDDFESAIKCGATHIRIGSALFQDN